MANNQTLKDKFSADKARLNELLEIANNATGAEDANIADAITTLIDRCGKYPFLPNDAELIQTDEFVFNLKDDTTFDTITPSASAQTIKSIVNANNFIVVKDVDTSQFEYAIVFNTTVIPVYDVTPSAGYQTMLQYTGVYFFTTVNVGDSKVRQYNAIFSGIETYISENGDTDANIVTTTHMCGVYPTMYTSAIRSQDTSDICINDPFLQVRANDVHASAESLSHIDSSQTNVVMTSNVYRYNRNHSIYNSLMFNL